LKRGLKLGLLKYTFNADTKLHNYADCFGLTLAISAQFTLDVGVTARHRKNETQAAVGLQK